jgi:hypothetical protein
MMFCIMTPDEPVKLALVVTGRTARTAIAKKRSSKSARAAR